MSSTVLGTLAISVSCGVYMFKIEINERLHNRVCVCVCVCVQPVSLYGSNQLELFEVNLPGFNFTSRNSFYVFSTSSTVQVTAVAAAKIPLHCLAGIQ